MLHQLRKEWGLTVEQVAEQLMLSMSKLKPNGNRAVLPLCRT